MSNSTICGAAAHAGRCPVSVEAISWALNLAPVPADRDGQLSTACKFVLVGLANHAGPDGCGAFPAVRTLMRYTGLSERTVRACLGRLEAAGLIRRCDPAVVAARIKRADRRPKGWDLDLTRIRADLAEDEVAALERQFPGLSARLSALEQDGDAGTANGVQPCTPLPGLLLLLCITRLAGCDHRTPCPGRGATSVPTGCNGCRHGVQWLHPNHP